MKNNSILAIVVSYNGGEKLRETVSALVCQVDEVVIIDNGSREESLSVIRIVESFPKVRVIYFGQNRGICVALNLGVEIAVKRGFKWVLTMDQDSVIEHGMIANMLEAAKVHGNKCIVTPTVWPLNKSMGSKNTVVEYAITSGNLVPVKIYSSVGRYAEDYFIDSVDFDFSLQVRSAGFYIVRCGSANMTHQLGHVIRRKILFFEYKYTYHSPVRRYYIYRNHFLLGGRFLFKFPVFIIKKTISLVLLTIEIILFDDSRLENFKMISLGVFDFLRGKRGSL